MSATGSQLSAGQRAVLAAADVGGDEMTAVAAARSKLEQLIDDVSDKEGLSDAELHDKVSISCYVRRIMMMIAMLLVISLCLFPSEDDVM